MWGIIPAAGHGSRIQPLAFSKELLPVGSRFEGGVERPRAVSEHLVNRMLLAGADKICFVISPRKSDIMQYYGSGLGSAHFCYTVQQQPTGLCAAIFTALPLIPPDESTLVGMPDTVWFPEDGFRSLPDDCLAFLLFPVDQPELFDAVILDDESNIREMLVKTPYSPTKWVWGAFKAPGRVLYELRDLWLAREEQDEYIGSLVNAYIRNGGKAVGVRYGESYVDVGTLNGYRKAIRSLDSHVSPLLAVVD